jgi:hypothetical protein
MQNPVQFGMDADIIDIRLDAAFTAVFTSTSQFLKGIFQNPENLQIVTNLEVFYPR